MTVPPPMVLMLRPSPEHDGAGRERLLAQVRNVLRRTLVRLHLVGGARDDQAAAGSGNAATVLSFPLRGEALLVRLADALRGQLPRDGRCEDPFMLTLSRGMRPRLSIDRAAYVEFHAEHATFHLTVDAAPDSRVTLETTDFDTLERFAVRYVADGCRECEPFEVAS